MRILLIEDDLAVARSLQDGLARDGYAVTRKACGAEGIAHACAQDPHLIILNVRLPNGSGLDVCRRLRQLGRRQPILMLTAQRDEMDKVLGLEMGADDYVTKPTWRASASSTCISAACARRWNSTLAAPR